MRRRGRVEGIGAFPAGRENIMARRLAIFAFGVVAYLAALAVLAYLIAFLGDLPVASGTVDRGTGAPVGAALLVDVALVVLFGLQHSAMARPAFKRWVHRRVPASAERSLFVLLAALALAALCAFWQPLPGTVWYVPAGWPVALVAALFWAGWLGVLGATFLVDHFDLMGLRQVALQLRRVTYRPPRFTETSAYRYVRHPMMLAFLIAFWATPRMSAGHLVLALAMTGYIVTGTLLEERDLIRVFGARYADYRRRVPMLVPMLVPQPRPPAGDREPGADEPLP